MFFGRFPTTEYTLNELDVQVTRVITNLLLRVRMNELIDRLQIPWVYYTIGDSDRPDTVATHFYGSPNYTWLVLLMNGARDLYDWPMDERTFNRYLTKVYGSVEAAQTQVYEYRNADGHVIDLTTYDSLADTERSMVSAYDQESFVNEALRVIRLVPKELLPTVEEQLTDMMKTIPQ